MRVEVEGLVRFWSAGVVIGDDGREGKRCSGDAAAEISEPNKFVVCISEASKGDGVELFDTFDGWFFAETSEGLQCDGACGDAVGVDVSDDMDSCRFLD